MLGIAGAGEELRAEWRLVCRILEALRREKKRERERRRATENDDLPEIAESGDERLSTLSGKIRVLLMDSGYESYYHSSVTLNLIGAGSGVYSRFPRTFPGRTCPGRRRSGNHHHFHRKTGESAGLLRNPGNSKYAPGLASDQ